ncbi:hypothetical protein DQ20_28950 [Pseudomonas aeruginosa]|nr:hypothetical protein DQ20_28950 [Pseudomonas aeruginosa]
MRRRCSFVHQIQGWAAAILGVIFFASSHLSTFNQFLTNLGLSVEYSFEVMARYQGGINN